MEGATREWVGGVAGIVTLAGFFGSLSISWQVWHAESSIGVAFSPLGAVILCLHSWLLYGYQAGDTHVLVVSACSLALMLFNAIVHRVYSEVTGPGLAVLATLTVTQIASPIMTAAWLGNVAMICTVICHTAALGRIRTTQLPHIAGWTLSACGLWTAYGVLAQDLPLFVSNLVGAVFAVVELIVAAWARRRPDVELPAQMV